MSAKRLNFYFVRPVFIGILAFLLIVFFVLPRLNGRGPSPRLHSSSNIRATIQGIILQSESAFGRFPQSPDNWQQNLLDADYAVPGMFTSPYTDGLGADYFFVPGGKNDADEARVVVYEDPALDKRGTLIGYADAHVEYVDQEEAIEILSNLTLPDGTRYVPHESDPSATAQTRTTRP